MNMSRRTLLGSAIGAGAVAPLAACGSKSGGGSGTDITYELWATPAKTKLIQNAVDAFEKKNSGIKVKVESSPWDGYWEKLATKAAGGKAPEVIHMSERYILEYGSRGALADLSSLAGIDTKTLDKSVLELGRTGDGKLYAVPAGLNTFAIAINTSLAKKHNLPVPDDTTWTWQDYYELSKRAAGAGLIGCGYGYGLETLVGWLRQSNEKLYSADGKKPAYKQESLKAYLDHMMTMRSNGAETPAQVAENRGLPLGATPFAQGKQLMTWTYSNQLAEFAGPSESDMKLLLTPSQTGDATKAGMFYKGSEFYSISSKASQAKKEAAAKFVNFLLNDPEAGKALGTALGVPPNSKLVEHLRPSMGKLEQGVTDYVNNLKKYISIPSPGPSPAGAGNIENLLGSIVADMLSNRISVEAAAEKITSSITRELNE